MATPKLRFKEFEGDWSTNKIEEISIVTSGGTPSRNVSDYWNGDIPWVTTSLVDFNVINQAEEFITQVGLDNSSAKLFPKDTILMAMYGQGITRGKVAILGIDATTNQACAAIKLKNGFETKFIFQNLMNRYEEIRDLSNEGGQKNLSAGIIKEILISFPEKEEQTKIASFLSAVDEKISQLTQKHELLSQYKQGMMQKLFSQQLRFKADDGSEVGEWEDKPLNEIASKRSGKNKDGSISEVLTNSATQGIIKQSDYFEREIVTKSNLNGYYIVNLDDFVYNPRISVHAPVGPIKRNKKCLGVMSPLYTVFTVIQGNLKYLEYFFDSNFWHDYVKGVANSGARHDRMNITNKDFFDMPILYPCLEEQTKIENFLSAIDQKIEVVAQQIEQAKTWKKGLLQQMFM